MHRNLYCQRWAVLALLVAGLFLLAGCGGGGTENEAAVRTAFQDYEKSLATKNVEEIKKHLQADRVAELDRPDAAQMLEMAAVFRPDTATIVGVEIDADSEIATIKWKGARDGTNFEGATELKLEAGSWKVGHELTTIVGGAQPEIDNTDEPFPGMYPPVDAKVKAWMDQIADKNHEVAGKAWLELAAAYDFAPNYLKAAAMGFDDSRPIHFALEFEAGTGAGGKAARFITTHLKPIAEAKEPQAKTVGEALRTVLWALEFQTETNLQGSFDDWYRVYRKTKGI